MTPTSLDGIARRLLDNAAADPHGRRAETVHGGRGNVLRQTLIALTAGTRMAEHASPGEATLLVLFGQVRVFSRDEVVEGRAGDLIIVPSARHSVEAVADTALLLTVAKPAGRSDTPPAIGT